jgi:predicted negative regulator of RcsB-dependent stress response
VKALSAAALRHVRYWWQTRPMVGLTVGWIVIALIGWRVWAAFNGHHD